MRRPNRRINPDKSGQAGRWAGGEDGGPGNSWHEIIERCRTICQGVSGEELVRYAELTRERNR